MNVLPTDGTFDFCSDCPAHSHCCRRIRIHGEMEPPFLSQAEAELIAQRTAGKIIDFAILQGDSAGQHLAIKALDGKCHFYRNGICTIYELRPLDCRLFPFDIIEAPSGELVWIVYTDLCPVRFDFRRYFDVAKRLLVDSPYSLDDLRSFAAYGVEVMRHHKYRVIESVVIPSDHNSRDQNAANSANAVPSPSSSR